VLWGLIPATHKTITWGGIHMLRVEAGQIVEVWAFVDMAVMLQQLGVSLQPPPSPGDDCP
jgi:predicted ester cyclase